MSATIPTRPPETVVTGTTVKFQLTLPDYSSQDGWALTFGASRDDGSVHQAFTETAQADGSFLVELAAASNTMAPGGWFWQAQVTKATEVYFVGRGRFQVRPNLATGAADDRDHVEKVLAALRATLAGKATKDQAGYSIAGRSLSRMTPTELREWETHYERKLQDLIAQERREQGLSHGGRVLFRI